MKPSQDYSTMTREEAVRHFGNRELAIKENVRALPLPEKFRLVAEFLEQPEGAVLLAVTLGVARLALSELEERAAQLRDSETGKPSVEGWR